MRSLRLAILEHLHLLEITLCFGKLFSELKQEHSDFASNLVVRTVGVVDYSVRESIKEFGLEENWEEIAYVPHVEVLNYQRRSKVLLVCINNTLNATGILPGKFFEYLASGRPILAVGPTVSDIGRVLEITKAGIIADTNDLLAIKSAILSLYQNQSVEASNSAIQKFSRKGLTKDLAALLDSILG